MSETENKENGESRNPESNPRPEGRQRPPRHAQQGGDDNSPQASSDAPQGDNGEPRSNDGNSDGSNRQQRHEGGGRRERGQRPQRGQRHHQQAQPQQDDETYETREGPRSGIVIDLNELKRKPPTALIALADDLVELDDPAPRGVALTVRLLTDGGGPLYRPWTADELHAAAEEARHAL